MASVARDMMVASLAVVAVSAGIQGWSYYRPSERPITLAMAAPDQPGRLHATGDARPEGAASSIRRLVQIRLASYRPPEQGAVQVVVHAMRESAQPVELGRFAVFPNTAFGPTSEASERTYTVPARAACPSEPALGCNLDLEVAVTPVAGNGDGAWLTVANASIVWR